LVAASVSPDEPDEADESANGTSSPASNDAVEDPDEYRAALTADLSRQLAAADGTRGIRVAIGAGILLFVGLISFLAYTVLMRKNPVDEAAPLQAPPPPSGAIHKAPAPSKLSTDRQPAK